MLRSADRDLLRVAQATKSLLIELRHAAPSFRAYSEPMTQRTIASVVADWLSRFEKALSSPDNAPLAALFHADSHWRDVLALTWRIDTVSGGDAVVAALRAAQKPPSRLAIDVGRTPPREVTRAGTKTIEAIFSFATADGRGDGVLRLTPDGAGPLKCWTLLTALEE